MSLFDLLVCPLCRGTLAAINEPLECGSCRRSFPVHNGVPILLARPEDAFQAHGGDLGIRPGYSPWKERVILRSLPDSAVSLDFGAGRQSLDDPAIIRMDLVYHPHVDIVADVHQLPFADHSFDFVFGGAVVEHLAKPWIAAEELYRVLKPGGYIYADCSFVFAYHGYPHHYFNASVHGLRSLFHQFEQLELAVGPFHGSPHALRSVLGTYLEVFRPSNQLEREFAALLHRVLWHPLQAFDQRIDPADRFRVAAGAHFVGVKRPTGTETLIPLELLAVREASHVLRDRFPQPLNISLPDNLLTWARSQAEMSAVLMDYFGPHKAFDKRGRRPAGSRAELHSMPIELMIADELPADEPIRAARLYFSRPLAGRLKEGVERDGAVGPLKVIARSALRIWHQVRARVTRARKPGGA